MFLKSNYLISFLLIITFIFAGCSTPQVLVYKDEFSQTTDEIPPIEISEYILGCGDELEVSIFRHDDLNRKVRVLPDGKIHYPLVGEIQAQGRSVIRLRDELKERLARYYINPEISVIVTSTGSQKVYVLGEVNRPGIFQLDGPTTVVEAIAQAGGLTRAAKQESILLVRTNPDPNTGTIDMKRALKDGNQKLALHRGDIVYVPSSTIANVERVFLHLENLLRPVIGIESALILGPLAKDVLSTGKIGPAPIVIKVPAGGGG